MEATHLLQLLRAGLMLKSSDANRISITAAAYTHNQSSQHSNIEDI
jgi:hypothetical protein